MLHADYEENRYAENVAQGAGFSSHP